MKIKIKIILLFLLITFLSILFYNYMQMMEDNAVKKLTDKTLESIKVANNSILDTYMIGARKDFNAVLKNKKALEFLKEFKYANQELKDVIRGRLYRLLYYDYEDMKNLNIRQFHFHTHEGKSLLRFHMPHKSGDSLMDLRTTIRVANTEFKVMTGFEGGRIYPGYRYLFPIIHEGNHLGSVEFSVSFDGIEKKFKNILPFFGHKLILEKAVSYDKVFKKHREFFMSSELSDNYYVENSAISKATKKIQKNPLVKKLSSIVKKSEGFEEKLNAKKSFSVPIIDKGLGYVVTFLKIKDVDNIDSGYIVSFGKFQDLIELHKEYEGYIILGMLIAVLMFILLLVTMTQITKIKENAKKFQKFIDIQENIIVLTDGYTFKFANKKFYDFFGYKDIEDFLICICDRFIQNDRFFSLANVQESEKNWIESLLNLSARNRIVSMLDKTLTPHAFSVSISKYDNENYIVSFNNISEAMIEKLQLEQEVIKDPLTKAFNRAYLDKNIDHIVKT